MRAILVLCTASALLQSTPPVARVVRHAAEEEREEGDPCPRPKHRDYIAKVPPREGFVMATRALRGEYDPADPLTDTERSQSLLSALIDGYPTLYSFKAVGRVDGETTPDDLCDSLARTVKNECDVNDVIACRWTPRLGGRFASVQLDCVVPSPEVVQQVFDKLNDDTRVKMTF
ncbi:hypothetical protein CTAYLR_010782 [Chrysophaeum taylorii]|uniref:Uncharacterized protein n=1 Tax=Chrysophaeum taylorii TaxID=2483200 RepID=A0AAD7UJ87_9STRA|nr:hypothetical protein CTAYLR_010782 [Chrysophaeum taylorii]